MKIIITYASAGAGHYKAAEAIRESLLNSCSHEDEIIICDALKLSKGYFSLSYVKIYDFLVRHASWIWGITFWLTSRRAIAAIMQAIGVYLDRYGSRSFLKFLKKEEADWIISTHFLPSRIAAWLKKHNLIRSKLITVITDYGVHPFWINQDTDFYAVATERTKKQLLHWGISDKNIVITGIPVSAKFWQHPARKDLAEKLDIHYNSFTVLLCTGSFGIGPLEKIAEKLWPDVQVLVVCASNQKLYRTLILKDYPRTKVFSFVSNMHELMSVSDMIVTKPGGMTITELLAKNIIPVFISPIPGQETENLRVFNELGIGSFASNEDDVAKIVSKYRHTPKLLTDAKNHILAIQMEINKELLLNVIRTNHI